MGLLEVIGTLSGLIVVLVSGFNTYLMMQVRAEVADLKVFTYQNFVSRDDFDRFKDDQLRNGK